jgi:hypothetical protein
MPISTVLDRARRADAVCPRDMLPHHGGQSGQGGTRPLFGGPRVLSVTCLICRFGSR